MPWRRPKPPGPAVSASADPHIAQQCLKLGLLDEVRIELVPVLLGEDIRYFDNVGGTAADLRRSQVVEVDG
jgi:dihydrofolate reductase